MKSTVFFLLGAGVGAGCFALWQGPARERMAEAVPSPAEKSRPQAAPAVKADAVGAIEKMFTHRSSSAQSDELREVVMRANPAELAQIIEASKAKSVSLADRKRIQYAAMARWAALDPRGAAEMLGRLSPAEQASSIGAVAMNWAAADSSAALAWARQTPLSVRGSATGYVLSELARTSADDALVVLATLDKGTAKIAATQLFGDWVEREPAGAIGKVLALAEGGKLADASIVQSVAARWARGDPAAALEWLGQNRDNTSQNVAKFAEGVISAAASLAPAETLAAASKTGFLSNPQKMAVLSMWLSSDPGSAAAWFDSQPAEERQQLVGASQLIVGAAAAGAMLPLLEKSPPSATRDASFKKMMLQWAAAEPEKALQYLGQLSDAGLRKGSLSAVLQGVAASEPEVAMNAALGLPDDGSRKETLMDVTGKWVSTAPENAGKFVSALPQGPERTQLTATVAANWALRDATSASRWAQSLGDATDRDTALTFVVAAVAKKDPTVAASAANAIANPTKRQQALARLNPPK